MSKPREDRQKDLFRPPLDWIIDLGHPLVRLAQEIDCGFLDGRFRSVCRSGPGQPPLPTRLVAGLLILKHMHDLSDQALCARWLENTYYQFFCGEKVFQHQLRFERSSLTRWRQRLGAPGSTRAAAASAGPRCRESCRLLRRAHNFRCGRSGRDHSPGGGLRTRPLPLQRGHRRRGGAPRQQHKVRPQRLGVHTQPRARSPRYRPTLKAGVGYVQPANRRCRIPGALRRRQGLGPGTYRAGAQGPRVLQPLAHGQHAIPVIRRGGSNASRLHRLL